MSHDIEADYRDEYDNEERRCPSCDSYQNGYCSELNQEVSETGHCDFFRLKD